MITLTRGDEIEVTLTCTGHDLSGATITTRFKTDEEDDLVIPNIQHTIDPDQVTNKGKVILNLSAEATAQMAIGTELNIITKVVQGSDVIHFHGKKILTVKKSTLR